jgi:DNA polymerase
MTQLDIAFLERFTDTIGPIGKSLGMLIRPTFIAAPGKTLVWGDWAAIEARVLPWLAASPGAEQQLAIFRASDADKTRPDVYVFNAAQLLGVDPQVMWDAFLEGEKWAKDGRQSHGKVPVLSLGFGGAVGALMKMAVNYKVYLDEATAQKMVEGWRAANQWAPDFWGTFKTRTIRDQEGDITDEVVRATGLWGAVNMALRNPGTAYPAGRVAYVFDESYMGGTLFCALPCGRLLTYPDCRLRTRKVKDKDTGEESEKTAIWYRKGYGWSALWHGKCAENITQAVAGSILRETLVAHDSTWGEKFAIVAHTHDEVVTEVDDNPENVAHAHAVLKSAMEYKPEWRADLPLVAEVVDNWFYTKSLG